MKLQLRIPVSRSRKIIGGIGLCVFLFLLWLSAAEGAVFPYTLSFAPSANGGQDLFLASVKTVVWWSSLFALLVLAALWISAPRWVNFPQSDAQIAEPVYRSSILVIVISSALAIGLLVFINVPRLSESLWNDEIWTMGESVHGSWHRDLDSASPEDALYEIYWEELGWEHALWRYESTNHHHLLNVLSKVGLSAWQKCTGAEDWEFNEAALRLLPFLCALGGLLAWALFFRRLGFGGAALLIPWILALHPWYQQHATGMRGYPLVFLLLPLTLIYFLRVLRAGSWPSWISFAWCQVAIILSWPGSAMIVLPLNLSLAFGIWRQPGRRGLLKRWLVVNLGSLTLLLPFVATAAFQIGPYLREEIFTAQMGWPWFRNLASFFFTASAWPESTDFAQASGLHISGESLLTRQPLLFSAVAAVAVVGFGWGIRLLYKKQRTEFVLLTAALMIGPVATYLKATVATAGEDVFLFPWYFIYGLPLILGIAAIGFIDISQRASSRFTKINSHVPVCAAALLWLGAFTWVVLPRTLAMREQSIDPRRESAFATRGGIDLTDPANTKIITAHVLRSARIYDPFGWLVKRASNDDQPPGSAPGLTQLMRIADTQNLTLFVNIGIPGEARKEYPEIMALIDDSGFFDLHSQHFGLAPKFKREVYRYRGGLFDFDFSAPKS